MSRAVRLTLWTLGGLVAFCVAAWVAVGVWVWRAGFLTVQVADHREGIVVALPVPAAAVEAVVTAAPLAVGAIDAQGLRAARVRLAPVAPLVHDVLAEIEAAPDMTFVEVEDRGDRVWIRKQGRHLRIEVREPGSEVLIAIPTATLRRAARRLFG